MSRDQLYPSNPTFTLENASNFSAGAGDALLLGFGDNLRSVLDIDGGVDMNSAAYQSGAFASFLAGTGRIAYAAVVKTGAVLSKSGQAASAFRNRMKGSFRLGVAKNYRSRSYGDLLNKYGSDAAVKAEAGRTNPYFNTYGAGVAGAGAYGAPGD